MLEKKNIGLLKNVIVFLCAVLRPHSTLIALTTSAESKNANTTIALKPKAP